MIDFHKLIAEYQNCPCGMEHRCDVGDIRIASGLVHQVGQILRENSFPERLLVVADKQTLAAADGILDSLEDFQLTYLVYDSLRVATMDNMHLTASYFDRVDAVLAIGTGSIHDPCRLACARYDKPLCLFATAPSMDGFAAYCAPIVDNGFKITYPAKSPEVIIGDTKILAHAPAALKAAGFGDMISKYIALIDWQVSHLLTGEHYCQRVADLTRLAADRLMEMADRVTEIDEETAGAVMESLLMTGIAMSFTRNSRPGSGAEHMMAHYWECMELLEGLTPNYHGEDVGVATLMILDYYRTLTSRETVRAHRECNDWDDICADYGPLADAVRQLNLPSTITDPIDPRDVERCWPEIRRIVASVPSYDVCREAMVRAGCKLDAASIGKSPELIARSMKYHPYMRRRLSLRRVANLLEL